MPGRLWLQSPSARNANTGDVSFRKMEHAATTTGDRSPPAPRRPWWRLHPSTLLCCLPMIVILAALIVPAEPYYGNHKDLGWPYKFTQASRFTSTVGVPQADFDSLIELIMSTVPTASQAAPWQTADNWLPAEGSTFSWSSLLADLAVASAVFVPFVLLVEWRRLRRNRVWQFTMSEGLAAMLLCAALGGWLAHMKRQHDADIGQPEPNVIFTFRDSEIPIQSSTYHAGPRWLARLVPLAWCDWFERHQPPNLADRDRLR